MEQETVVDKINDIVKWYNELPKGYNNLTELMYNRQMLVTYFQRYAVEIGELKLQWKIAESERESERSRIEMKNIDTPTKATIIAKANTSHLLRIEKKAEGLYWRSKFNLDAVKEVISALNQDVAQAREDWKLQKFLNQTQE